jgi:predicted  nucleic acid-binding Zn-ribbon protein
VALKCELKEANEQIDVLKKNNNDLRDSVAKLTEHVNNLQQEIKKLNEKLRCVEGYNSNGNETNN